MVVLFLGLKPHRKLWYLSKRPEESVIEYVLLNGCPSIVVPVKVGAPLLAWDTLTVEQLWRIELPDEDDKKTKSGKFEGITYVIFEYLDLCVDWDRFKLENTQNGVEVVGDTQGSGKDKDQEAKSKALKGAITLLVAAAIRSKDSEKARNELDPERSGIAMWRIP